MVTRERPQTYLTPVPSPGQPWQTSCQLLPLQGMSRLQAFGSTSSFYVDVLYLHSFLNNQFKCQLLSEAFPDPKSSSFSPLPCSLVQLNSTRLMATCLPCSRKTPPAPKLAFSEDLETVRVKGLGLSKSQYLCFPVCSIGRTPHLYSEDMKINVTPSIKKTEDSQSQKGTHLKSLGQRFSFPPTLSLNSVSLVLTLSADFAPYLPEQTETIGTDPQ